MILTHLTRVIPFLTFGNDAKMDALIEHFGDSLDFGRYDAEHGAEQATKLELFCSLTAGIEHNAIGNTLKDRLVASKVAIHVSFRNLIVFFLNFTGIVLVHF